MTTHTTLPAAVTDYFALIDSATPDQTIRTFRDDALVTDDGHIYRGRDEILAWLTGAASEYDTTSSHLSAETMDQLTTVIVRLTGNFPGGQVDLRHEFTLADGLIRSLTIAP